MWKADQLHKALREDFAALVAALVVREAGDVEVLACLHTSHALLDRACCQVL